MSKQLQPVQFEPIRPVKMFVIGGVYVHKNESVVLLEVSVCADPVVADIKARGKQNVPREELAGPTHVPCPFCGTLQIVQGDGLQVDLEEHIMRCRIGRKPKKDKPIPPSPSLKADQ